MKAITKVSLINSVTQVIPGEKKNGLQETLETDLARIVRITQLLV